MSRVHPLALVLTMLLLSSSPSWAQDDEIKTYRTVDNAVVVKLENTPLAEPSQPAYLGLHLERQADGKFVTVEVEPGSPASDAGIKKKDLILQGNGKAFSQPEILRELLQAARPGQILLLNLQRDGKPLDLKVVLGATSRPMKLGKQRVLLGIKAMPEEDALKVTEIVKDSPAATVGVKVNDILLQIDKVPVTTVARMTDLLTEKRPGEVVELRLKRGDKELVLSPRLTMDTSGKLPFSWDSRRSSAYFKKEEYRLAVIPIGYPDQNFNPKITTKDWDAALFSEGVYRDKKSATGQSVHGSLHDYYREISYDKLRVTGRVFDPMQVGKKRAEYASGANKFALLTEALDKTVSRDGKDALQKYDGVFFLYAGARFTTQRGGLYWPHKATMKWQGKSWNYFICPEGGARMDSVSVIAHEFGHMLGLPDLYAKPEVPEMEGLYVWCTMANGHGNAGKPLHFSAWCKEKLSWLTPTVIDPTVKQKLILRPVYESNRECFKVLVRPDGSEYFLLENRGGHGYDKELPGQGLLIWRVVDGKPFLEESHGVSGPAGPRAFLNTVPYPSKANTAFTPYTTPSSRSPRGGGFPIHLTNIRRLQDGRVTFWIGYEFY